MTATNSSSPSSCSFSSYQVVYQGVSGKLVINERGLKFQASKPVTYDGSNADRTGSTGSTNAKKRNHKEPWKGIESVSIVKNSKSSSKKTAVADGHCLRILLHNQNQNNNEAKKSDNEPSLRHKVFRFASLSDMMDAKKTIKAHLNDESALVASTSISSLASYNTLDTTRTAGDSQERKGKDSFASPSQAIANHKNPSYRAESKEKKNVEHDDVSTQALLARVEALEAALLLSSHQQQQNDTTLTNSNTETSSSQNDDDIIKKSSSMRLVVKHFPMMEKYYPVVADTVVGLIQSSNLKDWVTLDTALAIALVAIVCQVVYVAVYVYMFSNQCQDSIAMVDVNMFEQVYTGTKGQKLCSTSFMLTDTLEGEEFWEFLKHDVENSNKDDDLLSGYMKYYDALPDLSHYGYDFVSYGVDFMLLSVPFGDLYTPDQKLDNPQAQQSVLWRRFYDYGPTYANMSSYAEFTLPPNECANRCDRVTADFGFFAYNMKEGTYDCWCGQEPSSGSHDKSFSHTCYIESNYSFVVEESGCSGESVDYSGPFLMWNDTIFDESSIMTFSKHKLGVCEEADVLEHLCKFPNNLSEAKRQPPLAGERFEKEESNLDYTKRLWRGCTMPHLTCEDYKNADKCGGKKNTMCGSYDIYSPNSFGDGTTCEGIVQLHYVTCPNLLVITGSALGYVQFVELFIVAIFVGISLWIRKGGLRSCRRGSSTKAEAPKGWDV